MGLDDCCYHGNSSQDCSVEIFPTKWYCIRMTERSEVTEEPIGDALKKLLRPLAKLMITRGVTAPALYGLLKEVCVEVANDDFGLDGKPPTDSRVSVLTGVHRKDVRQIRQEKREAEGATERSIGIMATVVGRWLGGPKTVDPDGKPKPLPRQADAGPSFDALVRDVSTDVRPRTVLDELLRRGVLELDETGDLVSLRTEAVLPRRSDNERMYFLVRNVGDHLEAAVTNIMSQDSTPPFLERAVFYNNLAAASVDEIEARSRVLATEVLTKLNRLAFSRQSADNAADALARDSTSTERFRFGIYFYREDEAGTGDERD
ncbi:MAG: DUF6502 family protein [Pseudomonadota bacterium]